MSTRVVIVGGGFAGYEAAKSLARRLPKNNGTEIVLLNPTDYFLYLPLLPDVAAAVLDPRRVTVSLVGTLRNVRLVLGGVTSVDLEERRIDYTDPEGSSKDLTYDRLVLAAGSVSKLLPVPGVAKHAHGFRSLPEALYLRDHVIRQMELAASAVNPAERAARSTFVVVGAGYTGTEVAAQGPLLTRAVARQFGQLKNQPVRWLLLDLAPKVLPELNPRLSMTADKVLRNRGVEVFLKTSVREANDEGVYLTNGEFVPTRTLIWAVGVRPDPLVEETRLPTLKGRLVVTEYLAVPGHPEVFAIGDAAAVPDLTRPGEVTAMTAQHATRQGKLVGLNVAASLGRGRARAYVHHDLGFVVDLGGMKAAANPLHIPLSGLSAKLVTRGYHLMAMPGNRIRTAADWALGAFLRRQSVQLGLVRSAAVPLALSSAAPSDTPNGEEPSPR